MKAAATQRRTELLDAAATVFESAGIRASISDVALACGVLTGSLYHHFPSKEAIVVELVERYVDDLEGLAAAGRARVSAGDPVGAIEELAVQIAECAVRHRAALLLTFHEPPTSYGPALSELARRIPVAITATMQSLIDRAHALGRVHDDVDRAVLADRLCQNMLHVGVGVFHRRPEAKGVPAIRCRMLLDGIAEDMPAHRDLDRSAARRAANDVIAAWPARDEPKGTDGMILAAARAEFGRRGYEATTVRDIAAAAGATTKAVYRMVRSKEELLWLILAPYADRLIHAWDAVLDSDASPLQKLDALIWLDINVLERFNEENRIISVFLQFAPPSNADLDPVTAEGPVGIAAPFATQLQKIGTLLAEGVRRRQLSFPTSVADVRARCTFALLWTPHNIVQQLGPEAAFAFERATLLRGATIADPEGFSETA